MEGLADAVDRLATQTQFSGVVRVDLGDTVTLCKAYGAANRSCGTANTVETQFGIASGTKGLTALTVVSLLDAGRLALDATARSLLGPDVPLIDNSVTVEQLLCHTSGIGDYIDEHAGYEVDDYVLALPVHQMSTTEQYLPALAGRPQRFAAGERFDYSNSGYVVLALMAERATGIAFHELVEHLVCAPAGMRDTEFLRSDELSGRAAVGYLARSGLRTNVLHLPVRGSGDGGIYSTAAECAQ